MKKEHVASYTSSKPIIDGYLTDSVWLKAPIASDFTQFAPAPFTSPSQRTEVRVLFDEENIYIGAMMYDSSPDSILRQLSIRDAVRSVNADMFGVYIDGLYTQQTMFAFGVTAAGVQIDNFDGDPLWDGVWDSKVNILDNGWSVEFEIPYSQLRFPKADEQRWGINYNRSIRRNREILFWSPIDPTQDNEVQQYGHLTGIKDITPPLRLSFTPYMAAYLNHNYDMDPSTSDLSPVFSAGADMKYGINESFTLDVALVPDFSDVQSDNVMFNLSPFEVYYEERRPFFTEGVDLFSRADLFYSRRIGSTPARYNIAASMADSSSEMTFNPMRPYLINALKISGRTQKGLGIGLFNAVTAPSFARYTNTDNDEETRFETENFTNYNVLVIDQQFNRHSYISLVNTSVLRFGEYTDALATGTEFKIADKKNIWGVSGSAAMSHRFQDTLLHSDSYKNGYRYDISFNRYSGNFTFTVGQRTMSKDYDVNDLGFLTRTNFMNTYVEMNYNVFEPKGVFLKKWSELNVNYRRLYNPNVFTSLTIGAKVGGTFRNFLSMGFDARVEPLGNYDYFEPRVDGRYWAKPVWSRIGGWFSSDYRKPFALDGRYSYRRFWGTGAWANSDVISIELSPLIRFSDRFNMNVSTEVSWRRNSLGYVTLNYNTSNEFDIIFGSRQRRDVVNSIQTNYLFTDLIALSLRVRHYWAVVRYTEFYDLGENGEMLSSSYTGDHNTNYNAFNVDLIFRWRFAPGSELNVVWKHVVLSADNNVSDDYIYNLTNMYNSGLNNQFSVKALYFLDFYRLVSNKKKKSAF